ncbi:T-cell receptor gamma alternate reading frame protein [Ciconia maguari]
MLLLAALVAAAAWSYGFAQTIPVQSPLSVTKSKGTARLECHFKDNSQDFDRTVIHWYQQKEGKAPERLLFFSAGKATVESGFQASRYMVEKVPGQKRCVLTIKDIIQDDAATYYCAYWDPHHDRNGFAQTIPVQSPLSVTKSKGSVHLQCHFKDNSQDFGNIVIHWYQQKEGKAPERFLYFSATQKVDDGFQANKYRVEKFPSQKLCILTINDVIQDDTATYYCAYWHSHCVKVENSAIVLGQIYQQPLNQRDFFCRLCKKSAVQEILLSIIRLWDADVKIFGSGTKLIVSSKGASPPANSEIMQKQHQNQITYVCLIEKFYPEVIRVMWTDEANKEVTEKVVKGDTWKSAEKDGYSIGSWLTVPAENKDKKYYCKYEHESKQDSLSTQDSAKTPALQEDCSTYPGNGTVFNEEHLMHRTAYLMYIVLLLKSSMYYLIVLFFIYRMWAPTKHQGKKA